MSRPRRLVTLPILAAATAPLFGLTPTTTTLMTSPASSQRSQSVSLTATVTPAAATGRVAFFSGAVPIGSAVLSGGTATFQTTQLPSGNNLIRATYVGNATFASSSSAIVSAIVTSIADGGNLFQQTTLTGLNDFFSVKVADLNGDGKADLVAANINLHGITIALGNGDGTFQTPVNLATGSSASSPRALTVADFNMDGIMDVAVANGSDGTISILLGNGSGTSFSNSTQTPITVAGGHIIHDTLASDFNGDGKPDLVAADETGGTISVFLGNGDGTFQPAIPFIGLGAPFSIAAGDFNHDGLIDLAVSDPTGGQIFIFLGNGLASVFSAGTTISNAAISGYIVAGDFTGDGNTDLAASNNSQNHLFCYVGNGAGGFSQSAGAVANVATLAAGDFNGDGILDVAVTGNLGAGSTTSVEVHFGDSSGNFASGFSVGTVPLNPQGIAVGDFDGDGRDDFVVGQLSTVPATLFMGVGAPASVTTVSGSPQSANTNTAFNQLQVKVTDNSNHPLSFVNVTFTAPASGASGAFAGSGNTANTVTNANGIATAPSFTANGTAGSYNVSAAAGSITNATAFALTNQAGPPASIVVASGSGQSAAVGTNFASPLQAKVLDGGGNPVPGVAVLFTAPNTGTGPTGTFGGSFTANVLTNASGVATAPTFMAGVRSGTYSVTATVTGVATAAQFRLTDAAGGASTIAASGGSGQSAGLGAAFATALQATVVDAAGNGVPGVAVTFSSPLSGASAKFSGSNTANATTNALGIATATTLTANSVPGPYAVSATAAGVSGSAAFELANNSGASGVSLTASPNPAALSQPITLTATVSPSSATGQATFLFGTTVIGTAPLSASGQATLRTTLIGPRTDFLQAEYSGDPVFPATISPRLALTVSAGTTFPLTAAQGAPFPAAANPGLTASGDFNGDGAPDLVMVNSASNVVSILLGNGSGGFQSPVSYNVGQNPVALATADLNGDGKTDIVVANSVSNDVSVLLGNGNGTFQAAVNYQVAGSPTAIVIGDFDGDSKPDVLLTLGGASAQLSVLFGNGDGTFGGPRPNFRGASQLQNWTAQASAGSTTITPSAGAANQASFSYNLNLGNPGSGVPTQTYTFQAVAAGTGTASFHWHYTGFHAFFQVTAEFQVFADGASGPPSRVANTLYSAGPNNCCTTPSGGFDVRGTATINMTRGQLFGFILSGSNFDSNSQLNGTLTISNFLAPPPPNPTAIAGSQGPVSIASADFNGDGIADLAIANSLSNNVSVLLGNGDGTFTPLASPSVGPTPQAIVTGDFNGDGQPDIAVANQGSNNISVLLNNGGGFSASANYAAGMVPIGVVVSDFNGDGKLDLAVANSGGNNVSVLLGNGDGTFQPAATYAAGSSPASIVTADFDHDGHADLAIVNHASGNVSILLGVGPPASVLITGGGSQAADLNTRFAAPLQVTVLDVNGRPVSGDTVTFTAPAFGATALFASGGTITTALTNYAGVASTTLTANNVAGTYPVTAQANGVSAQVALSNVGGLVISSPASLSFTLTQPTSTAAPPQAIALLGSGAVPFTVTIPADSNGNWLAAIPSGTATPAAVNFSLNNSALQLQPGLYTKNIVISSATNQTIVPVTLTVMAPLDVPPAINLTYAIGGAPLLPGSLTVTSKSFSMPFTVTSAVPWVVANPPTGTTPAPVAITVNPGNFQPGLNQAIITISSPYASTGPVSVLVNLTVVAPTLVQASPSTLGVSAVMGSGSPPSQAISVVPALAAQSSLGFRVVIDAGQSNTPPPPWITVTPSSGNMPTQLVVGIAQGTLPPGNYSARIHIIDTNGHTSDVLESLTVAASPPQLQVYPTSLAFSARAEATGALAQTLIVSSTGGNGPLAFNASVLGGSSWITSASPSSGQTAPNSPVFLPVIVNPQGLTAGSYRDVIRISSSAGNVDVGVSLFVALSGAILNVDVTGLRLQARQGGGYSNTQTVKVLNVGDPSSTVHWTADLVSGANAVSLTPSGGTATTTNPGALNVTATQAATQATPGGYYALVRISDPNALNSPQYVLAVLDLQSTATVPLPDPSPAGLFFTAISHGLPAAGQVVTVNTSSTSAVPFHVAASTSDGSPWLVVSPSSGSSSGQNPGTLAVSVNPSGLSPGVYTGNVNISMSDALRTVNVTVVVLASSTAGAGQADFPRAQAAGCLPGKLVLTETGLINNFAVPAAWPETLIVRLNDDCGGAVLNGSVVASFSNADPPLTLRGDGQSGAYSATWQPGHLNSQTVVTLTATAGTLLPISAQLIGGISLNKAPTLVQGGTVNAFDRTSGALAPGTVAEVYGGGLASQTTSPGSVPLPTTYNGTFALIGGFQCPLFYLSDGQLDIQIPSELASTQQAVIVVSANNAYTLPQIIDLVPAHPAVASLADGTLIAQHSDFTLVDAGHPAKPGEYLVMYLTSMGPTIPSVPSGAAAPSVEPLARVTVQPTVTVDNQSASIAYAGLTPGSVGLYQINFQVPQNANSGDLNVVVSQGGVISNTTQLTVSQ